jgi:Fe2+ transport system protein FeoA
VFKEIATTMKTLTQTSLSDIPVGTRVRISGLALAPEVTSRLRELGFSEDTVIRPMTRGNGTIICEVRNSRIGLTHALAQSIIVSLL